MWNGLWSISRACLCGPEKPMIMSSSTGSGEEHTCKGGSWAPCFIKGRFQPFLLEKTALKMASNTNWSLWLKAPSLKNLSSFTGSWQLVAGAWINADSTTSILGKKLHICLAAGGLCLQGHLGPPRLPFSWPPPGEAAPGPPAGGQCPIEGFRMPCIPSSLLCPAPLLRLLLSFLPSPNLSLFSDRVFPNPKAFCSSRSPCPAIMPGWACCPSRSLAPWRLRGDAELYSECGIKQTTQAIATPRCLIGS